MSRFGVGMWCSGTVAPRCGAHAEYVCLPEHGAVAPMPASVSYPEAAALAGHCPSLAIMVQVPWTARFGPRKAVAAFTGLRAAAEKRQDLLFLKDLVEKSELAAVIGGRYPLERIADAHARVDAGHSKGNIVVAMA